MPNPFISRMQEQLERALQTIEELKKQSLPRQAQEMTEEMERQADLMSRLIKKARQIDDSGNDVPRFIAEYTKSTGRYPSYEDTIRFIEEYHPTPLPTQPKPPIRIEREQKQIPTPGPISPGKPAQPGGGGGPPKGTTGEATGGEKRRSYPRVVLELPKQEELSEWMTKMGNVRPEHAKELQDIANQQLAKWARTDDKGNPLWGRSQWTGDEAQRRATAWARGYWHMREGRKLREKLEKEIKEKEYQEDLAKYKRISDNTTKRNFIDHLVGEKRHLFHLLNRGGLVEGRGLNLMQAAGSIEPVTPAPPPKEEPDNRPPPRIIRFEAVPDTIDLGQRANLELEAENTDYVIVRDGEGNEGQYPPRGRIPVNPAKNTTYTATAYGNGTARATTTVNVRQPPAPQPPQPNINVNVPPPNINVNVPPPAGPPINIPQPFQVQVQQPPQPPVPQVTKYWGMVYEAGPDGKPIRIVAGARVSVVERSAFAGGLGGQITRFFGRTQKHGTPLDFNLTGEDGKYEIELVPPVIPQQGTVVNIVATRQGYEEGSKEDVIEYGKVKKVDLLVATTGRARKNLPARERIRGEFYTHFGWGGLVQTLILAGLLIGLYEWLLGPILGFFGLEPSGLFRILGALAILLFTVFAFRARGTWGILRPLLPIIIVAVLVFGVLGFRSFSDLINFDWYLAKLDLLRHVGVPQETIDGVKDGIRNVLSFLQFKAVEPIKPEAKKIGGFEAIQLKFGSKHNEFLLPKLFARMNYTLPVTVTNPNKFDTKLVVERFNITEVFMKNGSSPVICGSAADKNGKIELGDVSPEGEKLATVDFTDKNDCVTIARTYNPSVSSPMSPVKFILQFKDMKTGTKNGDCVKVCEDVVLKHNKSYGLSPGDELDVNGTRHLPLSDSEGQCECKVKRRHNLMDYLCFFDSDNARISLSSRYGFSVQGKGEMILTKTDADRKLAPRPAITSSAGPLTVTIYFVSDIHVFQPNAPKTTKMFIDIKNDGGGIAKISGTKLLGKVIPTELPVQLIDTPDKMTIARCSPDPNILSVGSMDTTTIVCDVAVADDSSIVSGNYRTVPVIVDVSYTYSQTHSTTIDVKKEIIPDLVDPEKSLELNRQFKLLPYYCPTKTIRDPDDHSFDVDPLKIFDTKTTQSQTTQPPPAPKACNQITAESECANRSDCLWTPPLGNQAGICTTKK